jgi:hypothetical protein
MPLHHRAEFDSPTAEGILRRHGLANIDAIFRAGQGAHLRHVGRAVWKAELRDDTDSPFTVFIKMSWGRRRWWPRLTDILTGQVFESLALREWHGLEQLNQVGLRVPQRMALFDEGVFYRRSAIILRAVPPPASISDMVLSGTWVQLPRHDRHAIFGAVARVLDQIHDAGLAWRCISSRHIFPQRVAAGRWELWLIDCEGVHKARSRSVKERDVRKLERALRHDRADAATLALVRECTGSRGRSAEEVALPREQRAAA